MKKYITLGAVAMSLLTTGCSNDLISENSPVDNSGKERIVLGAGDGQSAFVTRAGFSNETRIVARYVSDSRASDAAKCVTTVLTATSEVSGKGYSDVKYLDGQTRYWDDAYGRKSILSVYAVAIPNQNKSTEGTNMPSNILKGGETWATANANDNTLGWTVKTTQVYTDLADQDLTYSNNIQQSGKKGVWTWDYITAKNYPTPTYNAETGMNSTEHKYGEPEVTDGRMYFTQEGKKVNEALTDAPGHFDKGQMEFKHALSRIQVNLLRGEGYTGTLSLTGNLQLNNMPYTGTLNIKSGEWTGPTTGPVNMAQWATAAASKDLTYEAQVLPGYVFANDDNNAMQFTIGGNTYYITNKMLRAALKDKPGVTSDYNMLQGNRYIFDITVAKAKIQNITATIVDWNEVNAENVDIDNSHVKFSFYNGGDACTDINLYKYEQTLDKIYTDDSYTANPAAGSAYTEVEGLNVSTGMTSEYYKDNQTAYHFRSINNAAETTLNSDKTAFTMTSGNTDYHWGAPMKTDLTSDKLPYDLAKGYLSSIAKGIVAADKESDINLTEVHMMSQVVVKLTSIPSSTQTAAAKVNLAGATVKLTKLSKTGTVDMGSGLITPATGDGIGDLTAVTVAKEGETDVYSCTLNVIPQALTRGTTDNDYVGITIHTADNNEYYIVKKLSEIIATSVGSEITNMQEAGEGKYITRWYPGHKYIYTFNITKTEIKNITATIVNWNEVVAGNTDLDLEK